MLQTSQKILEFFHEHYSGGRKQNESPSGRLKETQRWETSRQKKKWQRRTCSSISQCTGWGLVEFAMHSFRRRGLERLPPYKARLIDKLSPIISYSNTVPFKFVGYFVRTTTSSNYEQLNKLKNNRKTAIARSLNIPKATLWPIVMILLSYFMNFHRQETVWQSGHLKRNSAASFFFIKYIEATYVVCNYHS